MDSSVRKVKLSKWNITNQNTWFHFIEPFYSVENLLREDPLSIMYWGDRNIIAELTKRSKHFLDRSKQQIYDSNSRNFAGGQGRNENRTNRRVDFW